MVQRPRGRRAPAIFVLAGAALAAGLAACSNGVEAGTLDPPSVTGVVLDVGELRIRNAVIVAGEAGALTASMTVINTGSAEDALTDLTVSAEDGLVAAELSPGSITLAPRTATVVPGDTGSSIELELDLTAGGYVPVTLQFENAGLVELSLPVVSESSPYGGGSS